MKKRDSIALIIMLSVILADRIVKLWCSNVLKNVQTIPIIQDVLHFTYVENRGAAFSILDGKRIFLILVSLFALGLVFYAYKMKDFQHPIMGIALPLVAGGAIGNLLDRIMYGYVVDFVDFRLINFAVFNLADIALNIGGALFLIYIIFFMRDGKAEKLKKQAKQAEKQGDIQQ